MNFSEQHGTGCVPVHGDSVTHLYSSDIRVCIQQPCLAKYRVPVFRELAGREGISATVLYADNWDVPSVEPDGFSAEVIRVRPLLGRRIFWHGAQWRAADPDRSDVAILVWNTRFLSLIPALIRARLSGVGTVLWGHGYSKQERGWSRTLRNRIARLADSILVYNHAARQQLISEGFNPDRVHVALNSLDQDAIRSARTDWLSRPADLADFRAQHGIADVPVLLFVSRLEGDNRVDMLLQSAARLLPSFPSLKVVIVGDGPDAPRLRDMVAALGLTQNVIFAGAIYEEQNLAPWFLSASAFCYPVNAGLSILHAFGYGLPVVTSDKVEAQNPEIEALQHGQNGLLYKDGDLDSLAETLQQLLADAQLRANLAKGARHTVRGQFSIASMVDGIEAAVRQAAESGAHANAWMQQAGSPGREQPG
jgi:glycosyltransferase involved in cell wall biosynthesis